MRAETDLALFWCLTFASSSLSLKLGDSGEKLLSTSLVLRRRSPGDKEGEGGSTAV